MQFYSIFYFKYLVQLQWFFTMQRIHDIHKSSKIIVEFHEKHEIDSFFLIL